LLTLSFNNHPMISMIAAAGENDTLGKDGDLLWHLPDDFKRFKKLTTGHPIIMGRKTFDTFPKLLPDRTHISVTRQEDYTAEGCLTAHSIEEAITLGKQSLGAEELCIIGGGEIYRLALPYADKIELTRIHHKFEGGDAFFPKFNPEEWKLTEKIFHPADRRHKYPFSYLTYLKK